MKLQYIYIHSNDSNYAKQDQDLLKKIRFSFADVLKIKTIIAEQLTTYKGTYTRTLYVISCNHPCTYIQKNLIYTL